MFYKKTQNLAFNPNPNSISKRFRTFVATSNAPQHTTKVRLRRTLLAFERPIFDLKLVTWSEVGLYQTLFETHVQLLQVIIFNK